MKNRCDHTSDPLGEHCFHNTGAYTSQGPVEKCCWCNEKKEPEEPKHGPYAPIEERIHKW